ncbi:MAG TPA: FAD:protein FMN transferase, partial [Chitinolyticbacter sp.]|nr:FAD:protein FMN transferase [Chitinolyticbacter sp.]
MAEREVLIPPALAAFEPQPLAGTVHALTGQSMGTTWSVRFCGPARCDLAAVQAALQAELGLVIGQMSHWQPDSLLCQYNRAESGSWHALPAPFWQVLTAGLAVANLSDGAFDPTLGALVDLWGFGPPGPRSVPPTADEIAMARARCGWQRLRLDTATRSVLQPGGLALDFSGI